MKELTVYEDGLMLLSEGIALVQIQSAALSGGDLLPDSPQRRGFEIMLDHIQTILLLAEEKLSADLNSDHDDEIQRMMDDDAELESLPD